MELVDLVITVIWFSGPKSRSVNNWFQRPDLALLADLGLISMMGNLFLAHIRKYLDLIP